MDNSPVFSAIRSVQYIIDEAIALHASDVHLEPTVDGLRVRYRCNGLLRDGAVIAAEHATRIIVRVKVLAKLDIGEKRIPQDGKIVAESTHGAVDIRVATFPGSSGEKVVLRVLDATQGIRTLSQLGCTAAISGMIEALVRRPQGLFIVTGPTGSGKTTTLYAVLSLLSSYEKNIVTLEDPVEYTIRGTTQGQIRPDIGFGFAEGIRALLRQDPDIIMVGEIRDLETARAAVRAALTGHLVLSTLHTTDAVSAITRLIDMGVEPFLINAVVSGVVAQRLIRLLCDRCKTSVVFSEEGSDRYHAVGCALCHETGYGGRSGIFELFALSQPMKEAVLHGASYAQLLSLAQEQGMRTLAQEALGYIEAGITTHAEMMRVL